ncbi:hypothetical protein UCDDA912_g02706 [Diaporthe ampelina]|uniref:Uncharacterized protein n=1 Tax=Diaporthe ampelina TaxID=1214573 RepID=A0A0G2HQT2_9PEZI|nr:hypothetical protein UCDDA912_g02706 [Diaporthe ampelina]
MTTLPATKTPAAKDEVVLARPEGVYTGDNQQRRRGQSCEATSRTIRECEVKKHQRSLSLAQAFSRDGKLKTLVKDWTPEPLGDGTYGSDAMRDLCDEFGKLAADIVEDFTGGK